MRALGLVAPLLAVAAPARARAAEPPPGWGESVTSSPGRDVRSPEHAPAYGVYGRFHARFDVGVDAGAELADGGVSGALRATAHYFFMAGVYAGYADALGGSSVDSARTLSFGVDIQPAFIPRWSNDLEQGSGVLDLTLDSISLALGTYFREPNGASFGDRRGFEASLGFGVPLTGHAPGPWLGARGLLRWDDPTSTAPTARGAALVTFGWRFFLGQ